MKLKRIFCLMLCLILFFTLTAPAFAEVQPRYSHTDLIAATIFVDGESLCVMADMSIKPSDDPRMAEIVVYMQRRMANGWVTVGRWSESRWGRGIDVLGSKETLHGYYYRAYAIGYVYSSGGQLLEETNVTSGTLYY